MDQYKQHIAARVISDGKPLNYRWLSRSLKVHVNLAKQMLYEFHKTQNAKHPKSVHATYVVLGIKKTDYIHSIVSVVKDGDDTVMDSSPPLPSSWLDSQTRVIPPPTTDNPPIKSIVLVREEDLDDVKSDFEEVTSIHIYSLQPHRPKDLQQLAAINEEVYQQTVGQDPLKNLKLYGTITNSNVRRRENFKPETLKTIAASNKVAVQNAAKELPVPTTNSTASKSAPASNQKKGALFSSFAKAKPKEAPKPKKEVVKAEKEDESMKDVFDDDDDMDDEAEIALLEAANKATSEKASTERKAQAERESKLRQMMDVDDEDDEPMANTADSPVSEEDDSTALDIPLAQPEKVETSTVHNGRRRGRRRVMKKKTYTDEEGYLVTREEADWESFSEDEPEAKKPTIAQISAPLKKKTQTKGQGNIMSFFGKK